MAGGRQQKPTLGFKAGRNASSSSRKSKEVITVDYKRIPTANGTGKADIDDVIDFAESEGLIEQDGQNDIAVLFEEEFRLIRSQTSHESDIFNPEHVERAMLRAMLSVAIDLIPMAYRAYATGKKENQMYAYNAICNQARELMLDLKLSKDVGGQADYISNSILMPLFRAFSHVMITGLYSIKNSVDINVENPKKAKILKAELDAYARDMASFQTEMISRVSKDIESFLTNGNVAKPSSVKNKKKTKH